MADGDCRHTTIPPNADGGRKGEKREIVQEQLVDNRFQFVVTLIAQGSTTHNGCIVHARRGNGPRMIV